MFGFNWKIISQIVILCLALPVSTYEDGANNSSDAIKDDIHFSQKKGLPVLGGWFFYFYKNQKFKIKSVRKL